MKKAVKTSAKVCSPRNFPVSDTFSTCGRNHHRQKYSLWRVYSFLLYSFSIHWNICETTIITDDKRTTFVEVRISAIGGLLPDPTVWVVIECIRNNAAISEWRQFLSTFCLYTFYCFKIFTLNCDKFINLNNS